MKVNKKYNKEILIAEMKRFELENGRPPNASDLDKKESSFPNRRTYTNFFGSFGDALIASGFEYKGLDKDKLGRKRKSSIKRVISFTKESVKECIDKYIDDYDKVPSMTDLEKIENFPRRNDFRNLFGSYNNAMIEFNLHPKGRRYSDNELGEFLFKFISEHDRVPSRLDFTNNAKYPSFQPYIKRFGSWNDALNNFNFTPENNKKNVEKMKKDLNKLCDEVYSKENRKVLTYADIHRCDYCATPSTYNRNFKESLGISLRDYVKFIGFDLPKAGMGMIVEYSDGEVITSQWEYMVSEYLRKNNVSYKRNEKYKNFITDYDGNKDCDYLINHNDIEWYVEVAGMLNKDKMSKNNKIEKDYIKRLNEKINMLESEEINYIIIYPHDLKNKSLDDIFSFLK